MGITTTVTVSVSATSNANGREPASSLRKCQAATATAAAEIADKTRPQSGESKTCSIDIPPV